MSPDFNFTAAFWFLGIVRVKPYFNTQCPPSPRFSRSFNPILMGGGQIMLTTLLLALPRLQTFLRPCVLSRTCQGPPKSGQFSNLEKQVEPRRNCYAHNVKSCSFHIKYFKSNKKKTLTEITKNKYYLYCNSRQNC